MWWNSTMSSQADKLPVILTQFSGSLERNSNISEIADRSTATLSNNLLVDERPEELNDYLSIFTERADPRPTFIPANEEEEEDEGKGFDISRALIRSDDGAFPMVWSSGHISRHVCYSPYWNPLTVPTIHQYSSFPHSQIGIRVPHITPSVTQLSADTRVTRRCEFFVIISRPVCVPDDDGRVTNLLLRPHYWATGASLPSMADKTVLCEILVHELGEGELTESVLLDGLYSACVHHNVASPWNMELEGAKVLTEDKNDPPRLFFSICTCPRGKQALTVHWCPTAWFMEALLDTCKGDSVDALVAGIDALVSKQKEDSSNPSKALHDDEPFWLRIRECLLP